MHFYAGGSCRDLVIALSVLNLTFVILYSNVLWIWRRLGLGAGLVCYIPALVPKVGFRADCAMQNSESSSDIGYGHSSGLTH